VFFAFCLFVFLVSGSLVFCFWFFVVVAWLVWVCSVVPFFCWPESSVAFVLSVSCGAVVGFISVLCILFFGTGFAPGFSLSYPLRM
jgi:hypothetical protein